MVAPLSGGAVQLTTASASPAAAITCVGASGAAAGVAVSAAAVTVLAPAALLAVMVKEYVVPFDNPVNTHGEVVHVNAVLTPPAVAVMVYPVMTPPPVSVGGVNVTVASLSPTAMSVIVGLPGTD